MSRILLRLGKHQARFKTETFCAIRSCSIDYYFYKILIKMQNAKTNANPMPFWCRFSLQIQISVQLCCKTVTTWKSHSSCRFITISSCFFHKFPKKHKKTWFSMQLKWHFHEWISTKPLIRSKTILKLHAK